MAIYLGLPSPAGSSDLPGSRRAALCFLFGLASNGVYMDPSCYQKSGGLLHHLSTLTADAAVYFCCTFPGVTSARRYLAFCPVKPGLSSPPHAGPRSFILLTTQRFYHYVERFATVWHSYFSLQKQYKNIILIGMYFNERIEF